MVLTVFKEKIGYLVSYLEGHRRSIGAAEPEAWDQRVPRRAVQREREREGCYMTADSEAFVVQGPLWDCHSKFLSALLEYNEQNQGFFFQRK